MSSFFNLLRLVFLFLVALFLYPFLKNRAVFFFLNAAGPSFIKLGQVLSIRPDLVGAKLAQDLSAFQDDLKPFSQKEVRRVLHKNYGEKLNEIFAEFDYQPRASASIAQVHKARLRKENFEVAVKILRPKIAKIMRRDIKTLRLIARIVRIFSRNFSTLLNDIAEVLQNCAKSELDMLREAANALRFKENLKNVEGFYIPEIFVKYSSQKILISEWIHGIAFSNKEAILQSEFDKKKIAQNLVLSYFHQLYQDGFFHADMHLGNLFLIDDGVNKGKIAAIDFGIVGRIDKKLRIGLTEIFIGYLERDYKKVARIHIDCGLVPPETDLYELSLACQKIGEKIVDSDVKDISLALLMKDLIEMTSKYKIKTDANLLLLHKTLMLVEGVGVWLDPELNMWNLARPWIANWAKKNIGFDAKIRDFVVDLIEVVKDLLRK